MPAMPALTQTALAPDTLAHHHSVVDAWLQHDLPRQAVTLTGSTEAVIALIVILVLAFLGVALFGYSSSAPPR